MAAAVVHFVGQCQRTIIRARRPKVLDAVTNRRWSVSDHLQLSTLALAHVPALLDILRAAGLRLDCLQRLPHALRHALVDHEGAIYASLGTTVSGQDRRIRSKKRIAVGIVFVRDDPLLPVNAVAVGTGGGQRGKPNCKLGKVKWRSTHLR